MKTITLEAEQLAELNRCLKRINAILGLDTPVLSHAVLDADSNPDTYADSPVSDLPIPHLDQNGRPSYRDVYEYIRIRKRCDPDFRKICNEESTASVCRRLTELFGWDVEDNSLRQYLGRKQKYLTLATIK